MSSVQARNKLVKALAQLSRVQEGGFFGVNTKKAGGRSSVSQLKDKNRKVAPNQKMSGGVTTPGNPLARKSPRTPSGVRFGNVVVAGAGLSGGRKRPVGRPRKSGGALSGGALSGGALSGGVRRSGGALSGGSLSGGKKGPKKESGWIKAVKKIWKSKKGLSYKEALMIASDLKRKGKLKA